MYKCPKCGSTDLSVTHCVVDGNMPLREDGFIIGGDTSYEMVLCKECEYQADLGEFVEENLPRSVEEVRRFCIDGLKSTVESDLYTACENAGYEPEELPKIDVGGPCNGELLEKLNQYAHECDIDERDGYAMSTGFVSCLLGLLTKLGFPSTEKERNLQEWAEAFQNLFI